MNDTVEFNSLDTLIKNSLLCMRTADIATMLIRMNLDEFDELRKNREYAVRAFGHYMIGNSIVHFDAAMCMRFMVQVVKKEAKKMMNMYKQETEDTSYSIVRNWLEESIAKTLLITTQEASEIAKEYKKFDYKEVVKHGLSMFRDENENKSDILWLEAESHKRTPNECYENLANAIVELGVRDYESALSGFAPTKSFETPEHIIKQVKQFAKEDATKFTAVDIERILEHIEDNYRRKFIPLVNASAMDIVEDWEKLSDSELRPQDKVKIAKFKCPNCGNVLRKGIWSPYRIECCGCNLSAVMPDDVVEELKHRSRGKRNV